MPIHKRRRLLVDPEVQGTLVRRAIIYWLSCIGTVEFLMLAWNIARGPQRESYFAYFLNHDWQAAVIRLALSSLLLVPIAFDMLRLSNRFAGPVFRMRRILRKVALEGVVESIHLRDDDYWHDFAGDLNAALARLSAPASDATDPQPDKMQPKQFSATSGGSEG